MAEFAYFNIMDVDPSFKPVDTGVYNLQLVKAEAQDKTLASGKNAGLETKMIKLTMVIVNDPTFSGRKFWPTLWIHNPFDQKALRKIADRTGIVQNPGESIDEWLAKLTQIQPQLKAKVDVVVENVYPPQQDQDGKPVTAPVNKVDLRSISA